jgi:hypothetical protein
VTLPLEIPPAQKLAPRLTDRCERLKHLVGGLELDPELLGELGGLA